MFNNNRRKQRTVRLNESEMVSFITETAMRVVREMKLREMGLNNSTYSVQVNGETEKRNFRTPEEAIRYAEFSYRKNMEWCRMLGGCPGEDTFVEVVDDTTGETVWSK